MRKILIFIFSVMLSPHAIGGFYFLYEKYVTEDGVQCFKKTLKDRRSMIKCFPFEDADHKQYLCWSGEHQSECKLVTTQEALEIDKKAKYRASVRELRNSH